MLKLRAMRRSIILIAALVMILGAVLSAEALVYSVTGTLDAGDPTIPQRIFRDGVPSTCAGKAWPGPFGTGPYNYEVFGSYGPVPAGTCVTINYDEGDCGVTAHPMAYMAGQFDPGNFAAGAGFLGDIGSSATGSFSFAMPTTGSFDIVVTGTSGIANCTFSFTTNDLPVIVADQEVIPHVSDIRISAGANVPAYDSPAGSPARLANGTQIFLPNDAGFDGADTYIVVDSAVVDGVTWVAIFLGTDDNFVWVNLSQVELIGPTP